MLAIRDQERAGLDIITDGEQRRESYSNRFATALDGIDLENPGKIPSRSGGIATVPRVVGKIRRKHPVEVRDVQFLRAHTDRPIKITVPGPFTMAVQCQDDFYGDEEKLAMDYAGGRQCRDQGSVQGRRRHRADRRAMDGVALGKGAAVRYQGARPGARWRQGHDRDAHLLRLRGGGIGQARGLSLPAGVRASAVGQVSIEAAQPKLDLSVLKQLPSKTIILGVIDLADKSSRRPRRWRARIRQALPHVAAERIVVAPDCGLKYLPREVAFGKMRAMVDGAEIVRQEITHWQN